METSSAGGIACHEVLNLCSNPIQSNQMVKAGSAKVVLNNLTKCLGAGKDSLLHDRQCHSNSAEGSAANHDGLDFSSPSIPSNLLVKASSQTSEVFNNLKKRVGGDKDSNRYERQRRNRRKKLKFEKEIQNTSHYFYPIYRGWKVIQCPLFLSATEAVIWQISRFIKDSLKVYVQRKTV